MNILFLTTHLNTGGITSYLFTLGKGLVKKGHKVWVVSSGGNCIASFQSAGIGHVSLNIRTKSEAHPKLWFSLPALIRLIKKENIHIIHAQTRVCQVLGTVLSFCSKVNMVTTCHGFFRPRWFRRTFPCWGKAVIAISQPVISHLKDDFKIKAQMIHGVPNGIDLNRFKPSTPQGRQEARRQMRLGPEAVIGIIARLSDVKGIDILIKAMPLILKEIPLACLFIVGEGPQKKYLHQLVQNLSLSSHVYFESTLDQPEKFLPAFDVFALPSLMEGLGLSVMEAQACGIPVVASRVGGVVDLIEDGISGYLVESKDPFVLAERIIDLLKDQDKAKAMGLKARLNIEQHFSAEKMVEETLKIYEQYSRC